MQNGYFENVEMQGGGQEMAVMVGRWRKNLLTTIQVNLCCLIPASLGIDTKFTWIVVIKISFSDLPSQPFLAATLYFNFFHTSRFA